MNKMHYKIWNQTPPKAWDEGLPVGNGRLAAMIWGENEDIISLNHEWLWRGTTRTRDNDKVPGTVLEDVRDLIDKEKFFKATALANVWLGGEGAGVSGLDNRIDSYQPAGDLRFSISNPCEYGYRELDMLSAAARVDRIGGDSTVTLTCYADINEDILVCRWSSSKPFGGVLRYTRPEDIGAAEVVDYTSEDIYYKCSFDGGLSYKTRVHILTDGDTSASDTGITVSGAWELIALIDINVFTDCVVKDYPHIGNYDYSRMYKAHSLSFGEHMLNSSLSIETDSGDIPTEERLKRLREGQADDDLILLFYNYGKYLFLASNICAELPANLQGKWNYEINPPWGSDYHFNINLQMNYWMAEPLGLDSQADKMLRLIESFVPHAKKAAEDLYGCRGIWLPHASDVWGRSTPESFGYSVWVGAAPWFAQHFWHRYIYSGDREFLERRAYPFFREVALFYEDYLVADSDGIYQITPSQSPENAVKGVGIFYVSLGKSSAMDVELAYDALGYAIDSARILGVDEEDAQRWSSIRSSLPDFKIGSDARLLEWDKEREENEPGHRHLSHLYGLYPSDIFDPNVRPEQYRAVRKSLDYRMSHNGGHTGWSRVWVSCLYARFGEGKLVREHLSELISQFATSSLLDLYPPKIFQIDANLGFVASVNEALVQYRGGKAYLLFGLPESWQKGMMNGVRLPGGHCINFSWNEGKVTYLKVIMGFAGTLTICVNEKEITLTQPSGTEIVKGGEDLK